MIGDKLIDPVAGLVTVEDVTAGNTVKLRIALTGAVINRSIHYVGSFERVRTAPAALAFWRTYILAWGLFVLALALNWSYS